MALEHNASQIGTVGTLATVTDINGNTAAKALVPAIQIVTAAGVPVVAPTVPGLPSGATPFSDTSYIVANGSATVSMAAVAGKTNYLTGAVFTGAGATAASTVQAAISGIANPIAFAFTFPAGVGVPAQPLVLHFDPPLPASAANTVITVTLPAGGVGNLAACTSITGYTL